MSIWPSWRDEFASKKPGVPDDLIRPRQFEVAERECVSLTAATLYQAAAGRMLKHAVYIDLPLSKPGPQGPGSRSQVWRTCSTLIFRECTGGVDGAAA